MLSKFFAPETCEDYHCEHCSHVGITRQAQLHSTPNTLVISFNRFKCENGQRAKLNNRVEFPEQFNIKNFSPGVDKNYSLIGVVMHAGGCDGGHYYSYVKSLEDSIWHLCDDGSVRRVGNFAAIIESCFGNGNKPDNSYMLFYSAAA
jgi:ubiquitin C-terminal hydrolase